VSVGLSAGGFAQQPATSQTPTTPPSATGPAAATSVPPPNPNAAATAADHKNMMDQLGIKALRPGPSGNESAANHANYDEALANPYPNLPDALTLGNGTGVATAEMWWNVRRPEIVEDFDREVLGRVPPNLPTIIWRIERPDQSDVRGRQVVGKTLMSTADNSTFPEITVEIQMTVATPANAAGPVPVMMMLGRANPSATEQLIAGGWGYATIDPGSIQAD